MIGVVRSIQELEFSNCSLIIPYLLNIGDSFSNLDPHCSIQTENL